MGSISLGNVDHGRAKRAAPSKQLSRRRIWEIIIISMPDTLPIAGEENQKEAET
jgi:hypothetical protein